MEKTPFIPEAFHADAFIEPLSRVIPDVRADDYSYELPPEHIAAYPLADRAASKLLVAELRTDSAEPTIIHKTFCDVVELLPAASMLVMNDSRVIAARIPMLKETGGTAEILCLQPVRTENVPSTDPAVAMLAQQYCRWECVVGGRNIREGSRLVLERVVGMNTANAFKETFLLTATIVEKNGTDAIVDFAWQPATASFAEVLDRAGEIPLPPYIKRATEASDKERYQTVYAQHEGSVAAPTAGLHFTDEVLSALQAKGVQTQRVTLHVGAGTFKPVTASSAHEHQMHYERVSVRYAAIEALAEQARMRSDAGGRHIVAVGTTSTRTLESLYWWGVRLVANDGNARNEREMRLGQWDTFRLQALYRQASEELPLPAIALRAVLSWMQEHRLETLAGETQLMIVPGYPFALCDALITNFHQPHSTLIFLVAAFLTNERGSQHWRAVYDEALTHGYRFLSYGDSSLLIHSRLHARR